MENAIEILLDEHKIIFDAIEATKKVQKIKDIEIYRKTIHKFIVFFNEFTEIYHHPKEETILYPKLLKQAKNIDTKIVGEISGNHNELSELMHKAKQEFINEENGKLKKTIKKYTDLLFKHIWRENIIIFKNIQYLLTQKELKIISKKFNALDEKYGNKTKMKTTINKLIKKINQLSNH